MTARICKRPSLWSGVALAVVLSLGGTAIHALLAPWLSSETLARGLISGLALVYVGYLMRGRRSGCLAGLSIWLLAATAIELGLPNNQLFLAAHLGLFWLSRALLVPRGVVSSLADLVLVGCGFLVAAWTALHTHSLVLTLWCFFLVQAFFVWIPSMPAVAKQSHKVPAARFERSFRAAEVALQRLSQTIS